MLFRSMTVQGRCSCSNFFCNKATQPLPRDRPYSALIESPSTKSRRGLAAMANPTQLVNPIRVKWRLLIAHPTMSQPLLVVSHLHKSVSDATGTLDILCDIDFSVNAGETLAIVGSSGSGKSTLLSLMAGLDVPTQGTVCLQGQDLFALDEDGRAQVRGHSMGFVFQSFQLLAHLTALENVMLPLELAEIGRAHV